MRFAFVLLLTILLAGFLSGCETGETTEILPVATNTEIQPVAGPSHTPKIASWLAKKDEIITSGKPFSLVMAGWFSPEEAAAIKSHNPGCELYAGLSLNWVWDNPDWKTFLLNVASYGRDTRFTLEEDMYLHQLNGDRCAFGWASEEWGQEEIYAMDPRNTRWGELILAFYRNILEQPQHDGIIVDMVLEVSWCPEVISSDEWMAATRAIMERLDASNTENKPVIFNAGRTYDDIDAYSDYFDGFLMENFMGEQLRSTFKEGLEAAGKGYRVIYAVDTDDTGNMDMNRMRLGLALSLLNDNTGFACDFGPRDHGQAWWFPEYDVELGEPLGPYFIRDGAYFREYENGTVVAVPDEAITVSFATGHMDITTGDISREFTVSAGDGRIYIRTD